MNPERLESYFKRIEAACGIPDAAEGCRVILKLVDEARKVCMIDDVVNSSLLELSKKRVKKMQEDHLASLAERIEAERKFNF